MSQFTYGISCSDPECTALILATDERTAMWARVRARLAGLKQGWITGPDPWCPEHRPDRETEPHVKSIQP